MPEQVWFLVNDAWQVLGFKNARALRGGDEIRVKWDTLQRIITMTAFLIYKLAHK